MPFQTEIVQSQAGSPITEIWADPDYENWVHGFVTNVVFGILTNVVREKTFGVNLFSVEQNFPQHVSYPPKALAEGMRDRYNDSLRTQVEEARELGTRLKDYHFEMRAEKSGAVFLLSDNQRIVTAKLKLAWGFQNHRLFDRG